MANRMQLDRRKDTIPWTWEPFAGTVLIYLLVAVAMAQNARGLAYCLAGEGWRWPTAAAQVSSSLAVFAGHPAAGLPGRSVPAVSPVLLYSCLVVFEAAGLVAVAVAVVAITRRCGPGRMRGMATRGDAQQLLGVSRLRRHAAVIRPDLYGSDLTQQSVSPVSGTATVSVRTPVITLREGRLLALVKLAIGR